MDRPSHKELTRKIHLAREFIIAGNIFLINHSAIICDALELRYNVENDLQDILIEIIENLSSDDYIGHRPPQKSYERAIEGLELFEFIAKCSKFKEKLYFKFAIKEPNFFLVSLHLQRK